MSSGVALSFNDPEAGLYGCLAASAGVTVGLGCGRGGASAPAVGDGISLDGSPDSLQARLEGDELGFELEFHAGGPVLALDIDLPGSTIEATISLGTAVGEASVAGTGHQIQAPAVSWQIDGVNPLELSVARTLWAELEDGSLIALLAVRGADQDEHGPEHRAGAISTEGEQIVFSEPLFSTAYDGAGRHQRTTLELWDPDSRTPIRGSGLRSCGDSISTPLARLEAAGLDWQIDGAEGIGAYEIISRMS